MKRTEIR